MSSRDTAAIEFGAPLEQFEVVMHRVCLIFLCAFGLAVSLSVQTQAPTSRDRDLLNSERIEQAYGNYGIEILSSTPTIRVSRLYSTHGESEVCRTFAVVVFPEEIDTVITPEHTAILRGRSIGATFAASGWRVLKVHRYFGELDSTALLDELMGDIEPRRLAVHIYVLNVARGGTQLQYANIVEVHHPDYLSLADLHDIYGHVDTSLADNSVAGLLALTAALVQ